LLRILECGANRKEVEEGMKRIVAMILGSMLGAMEGAAAMCPDGFLDVDSGAGSIGCIQNEAPTPATATWFAAIESCLDNYGARLATESEYAAADTLVAFVRPTAPAYSHSRHSGNQAMSFQTDGSFNLVGINASRPYRCFVPLQPPGVSLGWTVLGVAAALSMLSWRLRQEIRIASHDRRARLAGGRTLLRDKS
jgi:hypothetical protein